MKHVHFDCVDCLRLEYNRLASQLQIAMERNEALEAQLLRMFDEKKLAEWSEKATEEENKSTS